MRKFLILIFVLLSACAPAQQAESAPEPTATPIVVFQNEQPVDLGVGADVLPHLAVAICFSGLFGLGAVILVTIESRKNRDRR